MVKPIFFAFILCTLVQIKSLAQEIITDRPDQTEAAVTIPKGSFQIETGILMMHDDGAIENGLTALPTTLFRYGLSQTFELRLVHEYFIADIGTGANNTKVKGIGDIQIGTKIFLLDGETTQMSFISHLVLGTGNAFFSNVDPGTINKLSIAHDLSDNISVGYNLGYDYFDESYFTYSLAMGFGLTDKVGFYFEPFGMYSDGEDHVSNFDLGFTYLLRKNLQFDFSFGFGLNNDMNYTALGVSWNIPK